jgi:hypothetical protein
LLEAYTDPESGSLIPQAIVGGMAAVGVMTSTGGAFAASSRARARTSRWAEASSMTAPETLTIRLDAPRAK